MNRFLSGIGAILTVLVLDIDGRQLGPACRADGHDGSETKQAPESVKIIRLHLTPAPEPTPALKYQLLPRDIDRLPGNAAMFYYRCWMDRNVMYRVLREKYGESYETWRDIPLAELPKEKVRDCVYQVAKRMLQQLRVGTHREYCDWDFQEKTRIGSNLFTFTLPEANESRGIARLLALKTRLEIAERRFDDAFETLQDGYQFARHVSETRFLVTRLVGMANTRIMNQQLIELIGSPGSPNLYWALAELPRPMIDLRPAIEFEMDVPYRMLPFLRDAENAGGSSEHWQALIVDALDQLRELDATPLFGVEVGEDQWNLKKNIAATLLVEKAYPSAKKALIESGMSRERVEAMPAAQVAAIQASRTYRYVADAMEKWSLLPYWQARARMDEVENELREQGYFGPAAAEKEIIPLASTLLPAVGAVMKAAVAVDRDLAGLQTIEALRMHMAEHDGKLPQSLDEITVVPVPINPVTGKFFPFYRDGDKCFLEVAGPPGVESQGWNGRRFEITIREIP